MAMFISACTETMENPSEMRVKVSDYNSIHIGGELFVQIERAADQRVIVKGNKELVSKVNMSVTDAKLFLRTSDDIKLSDSLVVVIPDTSFHEIVLEADQMAQVIWQDNMEFDQMNFKTEARSMLTVTGMQVRNVSLRLESESEIWLDATTFVVENAYAKLDATSKLEADQCLVRNFVIFLEGESTASIWVSDILHGQGEGESILEYSGDPAVTYELMGIAQIIKK
jgi:hypothetical protein